MPVGSGARITLDAAFVAATSNEEMAIVAPVLVPAVLDLPVLLAIEVTVTNQNDSMTAQESGTGVLVIAGLVC